MKCIVLLPNVQEYVYCTTLYYYTWCCEWVLNYRKLISCYVLNVFLCIWLAEASGSTTTSHFDQAGSWEPIGPSGQDGHSHGQNVSIHESMAKINEDKWRTGLCALLWRQSTRLHARSLHTKYGTEIKLHQHKGGVGCIVLSSKVWFHHLWYNINTIPTY